MKIEKAIDYSLIKAAVVTIGTFDGVHIGHQKIISKLVNIAKDKALQAVVLTFFPHPRMVLQKDADIKMINTIDEKSQRLESHGVDYLVVEEFTKEFSRLTAQEFVRDILVEKLHVKHIIIGYDHRFGRNRTANIDDLRAFGEIYDFEVTEISAQEIDEVAVSSTKIRNALLDGNIKTANLFLGYPFNFLGTIVKGKGLGKQIEFPTANLQLNRAYKLIPKDGVYFVRTAYKGVLLYGMMNIGTNPTVEGQFRTIEMHLFDFKKDIYGEDFKVEILERLRDEHKFQSVAHLKKQLFQDKAHALTLIKKYA
ncbi:MAG: bifunctional riboflavin kinase/FAD synthetase [Flavobacteriaceae bacterium]|nr:bifunctional riboflavin kinase/FAD synthetase [Flavobacteriaceae bacterium]